MFKFLSKRIVFFFNFNTKIISFFYKGIEKFFKFDLEFYFFKKFIWFFFSHKNFSLFFFLKKFFDTSIYFYKILRFIGLGFKYSIKDFFFLKFDLGWSHGIFLKKKDNLFFLKKKSLLLIYGYSLNDVSAFSFSLVKLYSRTVYQIKGIFYIHEYLKKKIGKQRQK